MQYNQNIGTTKPAQNYKENLVHTTKTKVSGIFTLPRQDYGKFEYLKECKVCPRRAIVEKIMYNKTIPLYVLTVVPNILSSYNIHLISLEY